MCLREVSEDKTAVCEKTAGLRIVNSACLQVLVPVKIFQFSDMHNENRFLDTFRSHIIRPNSNMFNAMKYFLSDF